MTIGHEIENIKIAISNHEQIIADLRLSQDELISVLVRDYINNISVLQSGDELDRNIDLTIRGLFRMMPSQYEKYRAALSTTDGVSKVAFELVRYFLELDNPTATTLDDVDVIVRKLQLVGMWKAIRPDIFMMEFGGLFDDSISDFLRDIFLLKGSKQ